MKKIKLRTTSKLGFYGKAFRVHNYVTFQLIFIDITVGRPIVPLINKLVDRWYASRLHKVIKYYKALKEQTDADLYYQTNYDDDSNVYSGEFVYGKEEARWDWERQADIKECEPFIPVWLKRKIDKYIEHYYERQYLKQSRKEEDHEIEQ